MVKSSKFKVREIYRSAKTGQFITKQYAKKHPKTTMKQRVKVQANTHK